VIPGRDKRLPHPCSGSLGRGPTRLISPRSTFMSCGSSSNFHLRRKGPTGVNCWFPTVVTNGRFASVLCSIVRYLKILKSRPCRPTRVCTNRTGPRDERRTANARSKRIGTTSGRVPIITTTSKKRFDIDTDHWLGCTHMEWPVLHVNTEVRGNVSCFVSLTANPFC
jgi:hypothetical protein